MAIAELAVADETLGERLRRIREDRGLSQDALGRVAGITGQAIYAIEAGKRKRMQADTLRRVAGALGVTPLYLEYGITPQEGAPELSDFEVWLRANPAVRSEDLRRYLLNAWATVQELERRRLDTGELPPEPRDI